MPSKKLETGVFRILINDLPQVASDVLVAFEPQTRLAMLERLSPEQVARLLELAAVDDAVFLLDNLPTELTDRLIHAIVAFEVEVESLDSVFKLSQDRDEASYRNIIEQLRQGDEAARAIAAEMEKRFRRTAGRSEP